MKIIALICLVYFISYCETKSHNRNNVDRSDTYNRFNYAGGCPHTNTINRLDSLQSPTYAFDWVFEWINRVCRDASNAGDIEPPVLPEAKFLNFVLMKSRTENYTIPLERSEELWMHPKFDRNLKTVIVMTGWLTNLNSSADDRSAIYTIGDGYFCRQDTNYIVLDTYNYLDSLYHWAAFNTDMIGKFFARAFINLKRSRMYPVDKIHFVGHSLGAHIAGSIGKYYKEFTGDVISRITGLDPANPCFNEGHVLSGLQEDNAVFVDVIHTDPGELGQRDPLGAIDFYPNGLGNQPGCTTMSCAHSRAWQYYAESVYRDNEKGFMAVKCLSMDDLEEGNCNGSKHPMGFATPEGSTGYYLLTTNSRTPYGESSKDPSTITCNKSK